MMMVAIVIVAVTMVIMMIKFLSGARQGCR